MTIKLVALVLLCLITGTAVAEEPEVTSLMSKDLPENPGRETLMITERPWLTFAAMHESACGQSETLPGRRTIKGLAQEPAGQLTKFELVINMMTAKALGITIPPGVLAIADEVIE
jgi:hypothetical protein